MFKFNLRRDMLPSVMEMTGSGVSVSNPMRTAREKQGLASHLIKLR